MKRIAPHGLLVVGAIGSFGGLLDFQPSPPRRISTSKSPADALKGDWGQLGRDMRKASEKVREGGKS